jgi:hypothetical protein
MATVESSRTVSWWPNGQVAGSPEALIGRVISNVDGAPPEAQSWQRNS